MSIKSIQKEWEKSDFTAPSVFLLNSGNKKFAVVEDSSNIFIVASKSEIVYAVTKNKITLTENDYGDSIYFVEDIDDLKIISCTRETIEKRHKKQFFVITSIIKYL